ncbi:unnamed protein product [Paramecium primaurelia]|uniref:Uncharacterized protein n=2 Tax=Paramecium primaurelia TaxID=5886 RepID=A0A8S1P0B4_PARPR|nr:unnamed protein product [Paramecium primaurelia]CAD8093463.1 unnamed protein product [Paramecium primaurelia]CAD8093464.1 unnamed protein product [Paramecium primaurelia]CAD8093465.1 unnamed protein product [Paramecium primaurelia]
MYIQLDKLNMKFHLSNSYQHKFDIEFRMCMFYIYHCIQYKLGYQPNILNYIQYIDFKIRTQHMELHKTNIHFLGCIFLEHMMYSLFHLSNMFYNWQSNHNNFRMSNYYNQLNRQCRWYYLNNSPFGIGNNYLKWLSIFDKSDHIVCKLNHQDNIHLCMMNNLSFLQVNSLHKVIHIFYMSKCLNNIQQCMFDRCRLHCKLSKDLDNQYKLSYPNKIKMHKIDNQSGYQHIKYKINHILCTLTKNCHNIIHLNKYNLNKLLFYRNDKLLAHLWNSSIKQPESQLKHTCCSQINTSFASTRTLFASITKVSRSASITFYRSIQELTSRLAFYRAIQEKQLIQRIYVCMLFPQDNMIVCNLNIEKMQVHCKQHTLKHIMSTKFPQRNIHQYRLSMLQHLSNLHMVTNKLYSCLIPKQLEFPDYEHSVQGDWQDSQVLLSLIKPERIRKCHKGMSIINSIWVNKINNWWLRFHRWHKGYRMKSKHFLI